MEICNLCMYQSLYCFYKESFLNRLWSEWIFREKKNRWNFFLSTYSWFPVGLINKMDKNHSSNVCNQSIILSFAPLPHTTSNYSIDLYQYRKQRNGNVSRMHTLLSLSFSSCPDISSFIEYHTQQLEGVTSINLLCTYIYTQRKHPCVFDKFV